MKRAFLLAAILSFATIAIAAGRASAAGSGPVAQAGQLFDDGKYQQAIDLLTPYIAANPKDAKALVLRGDSKASLGDDKGALADYDTAIDTSPDYQYAYVTRCETRLNLDRVADALDDCNRAISLDVNDGHAYEDRADVYFTREDYTLALTDYNKAVDLGRTTAYLFGARCDANRLVGSLDTAASDCARSLQIDPKSRRGLWANGRLNLKNHKYADAIAFFTTYIAQKPDGSSTAYYFRGYAYNRSAQFQNALDDENTYVGRSADDPDGYAERAIAKYNRGDAAGAKADFDKALAGYQNDKDGDAVARVRSWEATLDAKGTLP